MCSFPAQRDNCGCSSSEVDPASRLEAKLGAQHKSVLVSSLIVPPDIYLRQDAKVLADEVAKLRSVSFFQEINR